jgi:hypothetical protein
LYPAKQFFQKGKILLQLEAPPLSFTFDMKYLAAYLLLRAGGKDAPAAEDVKSVFESVGIEADSDRLNSLISALEGKNVDEVRIST